MTPSCLRSPDPVVAFARKRSLDVALVCLTSVLLAACGDATGPDAACEPYVFDLLPASQPCADGDALCERYLGIWRDQLVARNGLSAAYFAEHVSVDTARLESWSAGDSFRVEYTVRIAWAVIPESDQFVVRLSSSESAYQHLPIPRDVFLSQAEVEMVLDEGVFASSVTPLIPIEELAFCSEAEAVTALQEIAGTDRIGFDRISYYVPGQLPREDGYPRLFGRGVLDAAQNRCIVGRLHLVTGSGEAWEDVCRRPTND